MAGFRALLTAEYRVGIAITAVALPGLIYLGNPAIALLLAAIVAISLDRSIIPGAEKTGKYALQTAIVLLGFSIDSERLFTLSRDFALPVAAYVLLTLGAGLLLGMMIRNDKTATKLTAAGTAICGGTAIASLSPIVRATSAQTATVIALVFLLNAVALLMFPFIGEYLGMTQAQFGVWAALAIHDTSSVVATASIYGEEAAAVATTLKLGRTLWLIPIILVFSLLEQAQQAKLRVPTFVILFVIASILGSLIPFPPVIPDAAGIICKALLVVALFCIGADLTRSTLKSLSGKVLIHGIGLWAIAAPATLLLSLYIA